MASDKKPFIEIDKKGFFTAVCCETILMTTLWIIITISEIDTIAILSRVFIAIGAIGVSCEWWINTANEQNKNYLKLYCGTEKLRYESCES